MRLLVLGYLGVIIAGTILLILPISTRETGSASFMDAFFTTVSASCVTGLVIRDTYTYWSLFGQIVILLLIQTGGIGFMTVVVMIWKLGGKKIGLKGRTFMQESVNAPTLSGMVRLTSTILLGTFLFELIGAFVLAFRFIPEYGIGEGIYFSLFTSVSAFCNAGFDLFGGKHGEFASLTAYSGDPIVCLTVSFLIIVGGVGFFVWRDIKENLFKIRKYSLHTKIVLTATAILIIVPFIIIFLAEKDLPVKERIFSSLLTAVSPRTAGFNVLPLTGAGAIKTVTLFLTVVLMFIGGSSGSTAGGVKTNTVGVLFLSVISLVRGKKSVQAFGRRIDESNLKSAAQFFFIYLCFIILGVFLLCLFEENCDLTAIVFEVVSAIGTVGLSLGLTPMLSTASQAVLAVLMFLGRAGCMTVLLSWHAQSEPSAELPLERVRVG